MINLCNDEDTNLLRCFTFLMDKWKENSDRNMEQRRKVHIHIVTLQMFVWWEGAKKFRVNRLAILKNRNVIVFCNWLQFYHVLGMELQLFKFVNYVHSINQMRLFWLLDVKYFSIIYLKCILFCFSCSTQNKRIWLIECRYFTYLKNCSSITNT